MPLDVTGYIVGPYSVMDLDVIAISDDRVEAWQNYIVKRFTEKSQRNRYFVENRMARWESTNSHPIEHFPDLISTYRTYGVTRPPKDVVNLLGKIKTSLPDAKCSIKYFYDDPILCIHTGDKTYHMAIWYKGVVRAIADGYQLSPLQHFLRQFVSIA